MSTEFRLPDLGEGIHEAEILQVKIAEGDTVKEDQPIFEVETDKAVVEIPCPVAGVVQKIHVKAGQVATVGNIMVTFGVAGEAQAKSSGAKEGKEHKEPVAAGKVASESEKHAHGHGHSPQHQQHQIQHQNQTNAVKAVSKAAAGPVAAAPATRKLARELGVVINTIVGSGPGGRVLKEDVRAHAAGSLETHLQPSGSGNQATFSAGSHQAVQLVPMLDDVLFEGGNGHAEPLLGRGEPYQLPDFSRFGHVERVPLKSIRRKTAIAMTQSWNHVPHVTHMDEADITHLEAFRAQKEVEVKRRGGRLTLTVFVLKAIASGLKRFPQFNASLDEVKSELVYKHYFNVGIAVATNRGLIVPVIKDVDKKSIVELSIELNDLAEKTRAGKIELDRLQGGSFSLTNIGAIGGVSMVPMVNYPEAAILGMARGKEKPVVRNGRIEIGLIMPLALSFDHRIADGAESAYFVRHIVERLEDPLMFLLDD